MWACVGPGIVGRLQAILRLLRSPRVGVMEYAALH